MEQISIEAKIKETFKNLGELLPGNPYEKDNFYYLEYKPKRHTSLRIRTAILAQHCDELTSWVSDLQSSQQFDIYGNFLQSASLIAAFLLSGLSIYYGTSPYIWIGIVVGFIISLALLGYTTWRQIRFQVRYVYLARDAAAGRPSVISTVKNGKRLYYFYLDELKVFCEETDELIRIYCYKPDFLAYIGQPIDTGFDSGKIS